MDDKRATRGNPSFVWRAGQERRFRLVRRWGRELAGARVLEVGCGVGIYLQAFVREGARVHGLDVEAERVAEAAEQVPLAAVLVGVSEALPYAANTFDLILCHEVIEHVADDAQSTREMVRALRPGGRLIFFAPNRLYPFETHGHYWQGEYHFGNTPLINWLPNPIRNRLAPHVRAYTAGGLRRLLRGLPVRIVAHTQIYPGFDNVAARSPRLGGLLRRILYGLEQTPLRAFGLSHLLVVEKEMP